MSDPIRVILVDDHAMMREGIRSILDNAEGVIVLAEAANGRDAIELASKHAPDIMLVDIGMPGLNGIEAARKIRAIDRKIAVIALSMHSDARYVTGMLDAGARGYLLKTCDSGELLRAIEAVHRGSIFVTSTLTHVLVDRLNANIPNSSLLNTVHADSLTPREREVLQLVAEGLTSKEIGKRLGAALKTIETHRTNVIRKLDIHSIAELTKYAIREGLTNVTE